MIPIAATIVEDLGLAIGLVVAGMVLLVLEILVVSFGLLGVAAAACFVASIIIAFQAGTGAGWVFLIAVPTVSILLLRMTLRRAAKGSTFVVPDTIAGSVGSQDVAARHGIAIGAIGVLSTHGRPGGRARFGEAEVDVIVRGPPLDAGTAVEVLSYGGVAFVVRAAALSDALTDAHSNTTTTAPEESAT